MIDDRLREYIATLSPEEQEQHADLIAECMQRSSELDHIRAEGAEVVVRLGAAAERAGKSYATLLERVGELEKAASELEKSALVLEAVSKGQYRGPAN